MTAAEEKMFAPEPPHLRKEALYSVVGVVVFGPLLLWWKGISWSWMLVMLPAVLVFLLGQDFYKARIRGRDFVALAGEGIRVTNRRKTWTMAWREIHRVHRFKEQLVFETVAPHRRETLDLEGHEAHLKELAAAISTRAHTMNLAWVETLTDLLG